MSARDLVVRYGDWVRLSGKYVRADGHDWVDLARISDLTFKGADWRSDNSVRAVGLNPSLVPKDFGPNDDILKDWASVTGVWTGDTITVERQDVVPRTAREPWPDLVAHRPSGGWDASTRSKDFPVLDELRASGAIVLDEWFHDNDSGALVLRVAASDEEQVRRALEPHLRRRTWIVQSRYRAEDVRRVQEGFATNSARWRFEIGRKPGLDHLGQPFAHAVLTYVQEDLAEWADSLPAGLLTLDPSIVPA